MAEDAGDYPFFETVSNLKFISKIREGEKVDVQSRQLCSNDWTTSMYRTFVSRKESRSFTFEYLRTVVEEAIKMIKNFMHDDSKSNMAIVIIDSLKESKVGFTNLKKTYCDDRMFASKIETLLSSIETQIKILANT